MTEKILSDLEAEKIVLGTCLLTESAAPLGDLAHDLFFSQHHKDIARAIQKLDESKTPINLFEVCRLLTEHKRDVPASYVTSLIDGVSPNGNVGYYRNIVAELARARAMLSEAWAMGQAHERGEDPEAILNRAKNIVERYANVEVEADEETTHADTRPTDCPQVPDAAFYSVSKVYRDLLADRTEPSDSFHLASFITMAGALLGRFVYMRMPKLIYPNHYTVLVGASNWAGKGQTMSFAEELMSASNLVMPLYSVGSGEGTARRIRDAITQDENLKRGSVICLIDEFNALINKANQKGSKLIPDLKRNYDWRPVMEINTSLNPVKITDPPTLAILAGSETSDLSDMQDRDLKGGLGNRLMFVPGEGKPLNPDAEPPEPESWRLMINALRETVEFWKAEGPHQLSFSPAAWELWRPWYKALKKRGDGDARVQMLAARHRVFAAKIALTWAGLDRSTQYIERCHLEPALAWLEFQLKGLYYIFKGVGLKPWVKDALDIVEYVKRQNGAVPQRKLQARFASLGPEGLERQLRFLIADDAHPERELKREKRVGKRGRFVNWVAVNQ